MLKITKVKRNSIGKEIGLEVGDEIVAFDGHPCEDELDYLYYCETDAFTMTVKDKRGGEETVVEIEKEEGTGREKGHRLEEKSIEGEERESCEGPSRYEDRQDLGEEKESSKEKDGPENAQEEEYTEIAHNG